MQKVPARKNGNFFLLKKRTSKLLTKLGHIYEKCSFFMSQLHNFLRVSQNIYQLHNFCRIRVSLFRLGFYDCFLKKSILSKNMSFEVNHFCQVAQYFCIYSLTTIIPIYTELIMNNNLSKKITFPTVFSVAKQ